jgi:hypothetical protein
VTPLGKLKPFEVLAPAFAASPDPKAAKQRTLVTLIKTNPLFRNFKRRRLIHATDQSTQTLS